MSSTVTTQKRCDDECFMPLGLRVICYTATGNATATGNYDRTVLLSDPDTQSPGDDES